MMHYRKGENIEQELKKDEVPFKDCLPKSSPDFLWMHVKGGTKINNVITYAKSALDNKEHRSLVWTGFGGGVTKTISCAEILRRTYPLYQLTRMCYTTCEEHWLPQRDDLEEIVVNRKIPCIHILLTLDAIDDDIAGVQKPNTLTDFWTLPKPTDKQQNKRKINNNNNRHNRNNDRDEPSTSNNPQQQQPRRQKHTKAEKGKKLERSNSIKMKKENQT